MLARLCNWSVYESAYPLSPLFHPMMSKKSVNFGMNHMIRSLSAVSPLTLINLTSTLANISHGNACFATQANWSRSRVVWPAYNFHLSIVSTVSFIFDFVVEVCIRNTGTITTFCFKPPMQVHLSRSLLVNRRQIVTRLSL